MYLCRQVVIKLDQLVHFILDLQERFGIVIGLERLLIRCCGSNLLANHDHRQQHKL
jgi:hypothetical protein